MARAADLTGRAPRCADKLVVETSPVVLGVGMPMFGRGYDVTAFTLDEVRTPGTGALVPT
ncbi:hypothetical protein ACFYP4_19520 [Streptomyces sp. NPDC005551]|uniref:hypothetical protein n=1 Tax=Streptomyces sp. NPDC005551 TaxID=3364725 RepID=UPI0036C49088